jgi:uncharacterized membrane protein
MAIALVPQFFLLIGINLFLAGSVIIMLLEDQYPKSLPYLLNVGGFIGFGLLWVGHAYFNTLSSALQFYLCAGFAAAAVMSLIVSNLYLLAIKKRPTLGGIFAAVVTAPSFMVLLFFVNAYLSSASFELPLMPAFSLTTIYTIFIVSVTILTAMVMTEVRYGRKRK